jgi:hypothetical protein
LEAQWEEEVKVTAEDISNDVAILLGIAIRLNQPLLALSMDFLKWFLQFNLSDDTQPDMVVITLDETGKKLVFWRQKAMPMGASPSSGVAQRGLEALIYILQNNFDREEEKHLRQEAQQNSTLKKYLEARSKLATKTQRMEAKLHSERGFTDDLCILAVGTDRMWRMKRIIYHTIGPGGAKVLIAPKTKMGSTLDMIGVRWLLMYGVTFITKDKKQKAMLRLKQACDGRLEVAEYRKLLGLLWFFVCALMLSTSTMNGLSRPLQAGQEWDEGPNTWVRPRPPLTKRWQAWVQWLEKSAGAHVAGALGENVPTIPTGSTVFDWASDACDRDEHTSVSQVAGVEYGRYWVYAFTTKQQELFHITLKEALGPVGNTLTFGPQLPDDVNVSVSAEVDALATATLNSTDKSKSDALSELHRLHRETSIYKKLQQHMEVNHVYGEINDLADAASRGKWARFQRHCEQLGVEPKQLEPHPDFLRIVNQMEQFCKQLQESAKLSALAE